MNRDAYNAIAPRWNEARHQLSADEARLLTMLTADLSAPATILDLGCGTGRPIATQFAAAGFRIIGVDQSEQMLNIARVHLPKHCWLLSTIESFTIDEPIAAAIAWDALFHIRREEHEAIFARVHGALRTGGRFAFTAGGSDHPAFTDTMFAHEFFYDSHPPADTLALIEHTGFHVLHHEYLNVPDGGRDKGRIAVVVEKR